MWNWRGRVVVIYLLFALTITFSSLYLVNGDDDVRQCHTSFINGQVALDIEDLHVEWRIDETLGVADFYISSPSNGGSAAWVAIGFSEAGGMVGSDIVSVQYFADSSTPPNVVDNYVAWSAAPLTTVPVPVPQPDEVQDWNLTCATLSADTHEVWLRRALVTQDLKKQDRPIVPGIMNFIYAFGPGAVGYHGVKRGGAGIEFIPKTTAYTDDDLVTLTDSWPPLDADNVTALRFSPPYTVQRRRTQYVCQAVDLGTHRQHMVGVEVAFADTPGDAFVHHVLVHQCGSDRQALIDEGYYFDMPFPCGETTLMSEGVSATASDKCTSVLFLAALNSGPFILPRDVGILLGGGVRYVVVEVHIDNPQLHMGAQLSNIATLYSTSTFRTHNGGSMSVGDPTVMFPKIRRNKRFKHMEGSCTPTCTRRFPQERNVFQTFLHMHNHGRQIWTSLIKFDNDTASSPLPPDHTALPSSRPTLAPTHSPTQTPTRAPSVSPTASPTRSPSVSASPSGAHSPSTGLPSAAPTPPSPHPTSSPSKTDSPTAAPSLSPTHAPSVAPTPLPPPPKPKPPPPPKPKPPPPPKRSPGVTSSGVIKKTDDHDDHDKDKDNDELDDDDYNNDDEQDDDVLRLPPPPIDKPKIKSKQIFAHRGSWNFNFQSGSDVNVVLSPGDMINTHCVYDTTKSMSDVSFGQESSDEMCIAYLFYYPASDDEAESGPQMCGSGLFEGGSTICGVETILEQNPIPDGDKQLPAELSFNGMYEGSIGGSDDDKDKDHDEGDDKGGESVVLVGIGCIVVLAILGVKGISYVNEVVKRRSKKVAIATKKYAPAESVDEVMVF